MPAKYGGRLASVLDISMKEGNSKKFEIDGGMGLISSKLTLQGPIKKDTSSFILSGRRTYIDVLVNPLINDSSAFKGTGYYFFDLTSKVNYRISDKDRLFSGYFGRDVFTFRNADRGFKFDIPWEMPQHQCVGITYLTIDYLSIHRLFLVIISSLSEPNKMNLNLNSTQVSPIGIQKLIFLIYPIISTI